MKAKWADPDYREMAASSISEARAIKWSNDMLDILRTRYETKMSIDACAKKIGVCFSVAQKMAKKLGVNQRIVY